MRLTDPRPLPRTPQGRQPIPQFSPSHVPSPPTSYVTVEGGAAGDCTRARPWHARSLVLCTRRDIYVQCSLCSVSHKCETLYSHRGSLTCSTRGSANRRGMHDTQGTHPHGAARTYPHLPVPVRCSLAAILQAAAGETIFSKSSTTRAISGRASASPFQQAVMISRIGARSVDSSTAGRLRSATTM